tara:strand:+ start:313 stop:525 length:213 start_codon:yes stop_codon:yes gene_type:complete
VVTTRVRPRVAPLIAPLLTTGLVTVVIATLVTTLCAPVVKSRGLVSVAVTATVCTVAVFALLIPATGTLT